MDMNAEALELDTAIRSRNTTEVAVALVLLPVMVGIAWSAPSLVQSAGFALMAVGCMVVSLVLGLYGRIELPEAHLDEATWRSRYAAYLQRQVKLLSSAPLWYVAPIIGGMVLVVGGPSSGNVGMFMMVVGFGLGLCVLNLNEARKLAARRDAVAA